ncbi:MAG: hypothetical protein J5691_00735 [Bacilli bacterium]|nr:hypothetical protein [Bacilli bacterium]
MSKYFNLDNFDEKYMAIKEFIAEFPPINEREFEAYARAFWGIKISVLNLHVYEKSGCSYELREDEETYRTSPLYRKWERGTRYHYHNGLLTLLDPTFGTLSCGGIARTHYGQTKNLSPERTEILNNWWGKGIKDDVKYYIREAEKRKRLKEILGGYPFRLRRD